MMVFPVNAKDYYSKIKNGLVVRLLDYAVIPNPSRVIPKANFTTCKTTATQSKSFFVYFSGFFAYQKQISVWHFLLLSSATTGIPVNIFTKEFRL